MDKFNHLYETILEKVNMDLSNLTENEFTTIHFYYNDVEEKLKFLLRHLEQGKLKREANVVKKIQKLLDSTNIKEIGKSGIN